MLLAAAIIASALAATITRGGMSRRVPAALIPMIVWALATQPRVPWPGTAPVALASEATIADIEAVLAATATGSTIAVHGDGIHPELLPLLRDRSVNWTSPDARLGLAALSWPRRVTVGEPVTVEGRIDFGDSALVTLLAPDGTIDSVRTDSSFVLRTTPRAAGRWTMLVIVRDDTTTLGIRVVQPARLRILVIAGRPDFEVPALVRRLVAQGADVTVRTRLTRDQWRTERFGLTPIEPRLTTTMLDSLDLVVLGADGRMVTTATEQRELAAGVERGLGVLHLVEATVSIGPITPFPLRMSGTERSIRLMMDGVVWPGTARIAPLSGPDSLAYLRDSTGTPVAWQVEIGKGVIALTSLTHAHRLSLAGHPGSEAAWWSSLLGPVLRKPTARWSVADEELVRANEPVTLTWSGEATTTAIVTDDTITTSRLLQPSGDDLPVLRLWPRDSGWFSVAAGTDTLALWAMPSDALAGVERGNRRAAMTAIAQSAEGGDPERRIPLPRWFAWLVLIGAMALAWRPR